VELPITQAELLLLEDSMEAALLLHRIVEEAAAVALIYV
jgi:hypothetical protein